MCKSLQLYFNFKPYSSHHPNSGRRPHRCRRSPPPRCKTNLRVRPPAVHHPHLPCLIPSLTMPPLPAPLRSPTFPTTPTCAIHQHFHPCQRLTSGICRCWSWVHVRAAHLTFVTSPELRCTTIALFNHRHLNSGPPQPTTVLLPVPRSLPQTTIVCRSVAWPKALARAEHFYCHPKSQNWAVNVQPHNNNRVHHSN
jgi:hypothetical protein